MNSKKEQQSQFGSADSPGHPASVQASALEQAIKGLGGTLMYQNHPVMDQALCGLSQPTLSDYVHHRKGQAGHGVANCPLSHSPNV